MTIYGVEAFRGLNDQTRRKAVAQKLNYVVVNGNAYDTETGESLEGRYVHDLIPLRTDKQYQIIESKMELGDHEQENGGFVFTFFKQSRMISERFPTLNNADIARLMYIGTYIAWQTGRLQYDNGKVIDRQGFEKLTGLSQKRARELFNRYVDEGILSEQQDGIYMNATVFYRGNVSDIKHEVIDLQYTRLFKKTVRDLYEKSNGRTVGQLALVYSVLPFLNFATNIVCYNPDESDTDLVKPMNLEKLAEILEYGNPSKLKAALNRVKIDDKVVFGFFENVNDRRQKRITVNPRVVYSGNGEHLAAIKAQFN